MEEEREVQGKAKAMFLLVGGEGKDAQGCDYDNRHFQHTSIPFIGKAYQSLRDAGIEREQIIVIAQVDDYLKKTLGSWLLSYPDSQKKFIQDQIDRTTAACSLLLKEGGAHYDHADVNPATVLNVLTGKQQHSSSKVIPSHHTGPIFIAIYSHGDSHPTKAGLDAPHCALTAEWFAHMPYPTPEHHQPYYDFVATQHANNDRSGKSLAPCLLYSTQLRQCFHSLFQQQPTRPIIGLLNYCRSGGGLEFMRRMVSRRHLGVDHWPLFLMSSSDAHVDSLVGGFWDAWFGSLCRKVPEYMPTNSAHSALSTSSDWNTAEVPEQNRYIHHSHDKLSLKHIYQDASIRYFDENLYALMNEVKERCFSQPIWNLEFKWPGMKDGNRDPWHLDLRCHLIADTEGMHGEANYEIIKSLQEAYTSGVAFRLIKRCEAFDQGIAEWGDGKHLVVWTGRRHVCDYGERRWEVDQVDQLLQEYGLEPSLPFPVELTAWKGDNAGEIVDLVNVVKEGLKVVARPGVVFGEHSKVEDMSVLDLLPGHG